MNQNIQIINQIFEIQQKLKQDNSIDRYDRNFRRLFSIFEEEGYICKNPSGEKYSGTRTDCEANIVGKEGRNMEITQVIKPIIYKQEGSNITIVQKGIVLVENK